MVPVHKNKQVATVLIARDRIADAPCRIKLRISTTGNYGRVKVLLTAEVSVGDPGPHCSLVPVDPWVHARIASRSVQPFLQGPRSLPTSMQTDHATCETIGRIRCRALQSGLTSRRRKFVHLAPVSLRLNATDIETRSLV